MMNKHHPGKIEKWRIYCCDNQFKQISSDKNLIKFVIGEKAPECNKSEDNGVKKLTDYCGGVVSQPEVFHSR